MSVRSVGKVFFCAVCNKYQCCMCFQQLVKSMLSPPGSGLKDSCSLLEGCQGFMHLPGTVSSAPIRNAGSAV